MWKALLGLLQALPKLLGWGEQLYAALISFIERKERESKIKKAKAAIDHARKKRDQRRIEDHFGKKSAKRRRKSRTPSK